MAEIIGKAIPPQRKRVIDALHLREPDKVPVGLWGTIEDRFGLRLMPVGYRLRLEKPD